MTSKYIPQTKSVHKYILFSTQDAYHAHLWDVHPLDKFNMTLYTKTLYTARWFNTASQQTCVNLIHNIHICCNEKLHFIAMTSLQILSSSQGKIWPAELWAFHKCIAILNHSEDHYAVINTWVSENSYPDIPNT